jgi:hypothetical protein
MSTPRGPPIIFVAPQVATIVEAAIVDAVTFANLANAFGLLVVVILPPVPNAPRKRFEVIAAVAPFKVLKSP